MTTSYGSSTALDPTLVTAHSVTIAGLAPSTTYNWRVRSMDAAGNETVSANSTFATAAVSDTTVPTVTWSGPPANSILLGTVTLTATASDNVAVGGVQFLLDGNTLLGTEDTTSPYSFSWNTTTASNGTHTLQARARDTSGNTATTAAISVTVDNLAPTGSVVINGNAAATRNTTVTLTLSASDTQGPVTQMRFSNDGTTFSAAEAYATSKSWALTSGDGTKTVYVQYRDAAGNWSTAATDTIVLDTTAPSTSAITATVVTSSSVTITWTTNEPSTSQVDYGPTTSYGSTTPLDSTLVTAHSVTLIGLTSNATYNFRVHSSDALANEAVSANATFIIDTAAPSIPIGLTATAISSTQINLSWARIDRQRGGDRLSSATGRNCDRDGGEHLLQQHGPDGRNELCLHGEGSRRRRQRIGGIRLRRMPRRSRPTRRCPRRRSPRRRDLRHFRVRSQSAPMRPIMSE